jgi:hypothetical protein
VNQQPRSLAGTRSVLRALRAEHADRETDALYRYEAAA